MVVGMKTSRKSVVLPLTLSCLLLAAVQCLMYPTTAFPAQLNPGRPAPEFILPGMDGKGLFASQLLLEELPHTLLIFWNTDCEECLKAVEACDALADSLGTLGVGLVGINHEAGGVGPALDFLRDRGIRFLQLSDVDRRVTTEYGAEQFSFSVFLIDSAGIVQDFFYDTPPDAQKLLFNMLAPVLESPVARPEQAEATGGVASRSVGKGLAGVRRAAIRTERIRSGIRVTGDLRVRALDLQVLEDDWGPSEPTGPYGEALEQGKSLTYRLQCQVTAEVASWLAAGALLRLSNESEEVLELGPQYFSNEMGSVFARYLGGSFSARLGYFDAHFSPLSLMRWDIEDNPRTGGRTSSCACAGSAGAYLLQSLEELGPDLTFEGLDLSWGFQSLATVRAFYAVPRTAHGVSYAALEPGSETLLDFRYRRDLYGIRADFSPWYAAGTPRPGVSFHSIVARDDEESASLPLAGYEWLVSATNGQVYGGRITLPVGHTFSVEAEFDRTRTDDDVRQASDDIRYGKGFLGTVEADPAAWLSASAACLYTSDDFVSAYSALSYVPNRRGARLSLNFHLDRLGVDLFAKYLEPVEPDSLESTVISTLVLENELAVGVWGAVPLVSGIEAGAGWVMERGTYDAYRAGGVYVPEELGFGRGLTRGKHIFTAQVERILDRKSHVDLLYQYTKYSDETDSRNDFSSHRTSLQVTAAF